MQRNGVQEYDCLSALLGGMGGGGGGGLKGSVYHYVQYQDGIMYNSSVVTGGCMLHGGEKGQSLIPHLQCGA